MSYKDAPVVTTRPCSTSILAVASKDRFANYVQERFGISALTENASPYDFTINKPGNLMSGFFTRLAVTEFSMDWTIPNINNNTFFMNVIYQPTGTGPATTSTIQIPNGFYSPKELAAYIQTFIQGLDTSLASVVFNYGTAGNGAYFSYVNLSGSLPKATIAFSPLTTNPSTNKPIPDTQKQLFDLLGFGTKNQVLATSGFGVSTFCVYTDYVDVVCSQLTYNQPLKDTMTQNIVRDTLCRVYLNQINGQMNANTTAAGTATFATTGSRPFQIYHNYTHPKQINWTPNQNVGQLRFQLFDDSGNPLSEAISQYIGGNWQMTLLVTEN